MSIATVGISERGIKKGFKGVVEFTLSSRLPKIEFQDRFMVHGMVVTVCPYVPIEDPRIDHGKGYYYDLKDLVPSNQIIEKGQWSVLNDETIAVYFENEFEYEEPVDLVGLLTYTMKATPFYEKTTKKKKGWNEVERRFLEFLLPNKDRLLNKANKYEDRSDRYYEKVDRVKRILKDPERLQELDEEWEEE